MSKRQDISKLTEKEIDNELMELFCNQPLSYEWQLRLDILFDKIEHHFAKAKNPYLIMPIERVRTDAVYGVSLARTALRQREPEQADKLGIGVEPKKDLR